MNAISLWQPWASLWCSSRKVHETRSWRCSHRGWLLVHAGQRFEKNFAPDDPLRVVLDNEFGTDWERELPVGALIGMVNVVACLPTQMSFRDAAASDDDRTCGDFAASRFAWRRDEFRLFGRPIPYRGRQRIFNVPDDLVAITEPCLSRGSKGGMPVALNEHGHSGVHSDGDPGVSDATWGSIARWSRSKQPARNLVPFAQGPRLRSELLQRDGLPSRGQRVDRR
jgi:activating signal cointegrator 1